MRLLNIDSLELEEYVSHNAPPYTILSHTWGLEEITFRDLQNGDFTRPIGLRKLQLLCDQTRHDGYQFTWIDTCCIDKSSGAELAESINSMYEWYSKAKICYVYLSDVLYTQGEKIDRNSAFYRSRWFTRGWTLQELLAPSLVIFFDTSWCPIGSKKTLLDVISDTTGIPSSCLSGTTVPAEFSVATRFSWASKRTCTRPEDVAYSLMGLFNINMPLIYGEGERAFLRLQEEIVKINNDPSILAWDVSDNDTRCWRRSSVFAKSPADFANAARIRQFTNVEWPSHFITNRGLSISLPLDTLPDRDISYRLKDFKVENATKLQAAYLCCGPDAQHVVQITLVSSRSFSSTQSSSPTFQRIAEPQRLSKLRDDLQCKAMHIEIAYRRLRHRVSITSSELFIPEDLIQDKDPTELSSSFGPEDKTLIRAVVDILNKEMVPNVDARSFIPEGILNGDLDDVMLQSLQDLPRSPSSVGVEIGKRLFSTCRKTFAILALSDLLPFFPEMVGKLRISDEDLPMPDPDLLYASMLIIGNDKEERLIKWKSVTRLFGRKSSTRIFFGNQWCVLAPVFRNAGHIRHYSLSQNHVLPFVRSISGASGKDIAQSGMNSFKVRIPSEIRKIYIHTDHHDFEAESGSLPTGIGSTRNPTRVFAVKELRGHDRQYFEKEKYALECLRPSGSRNILELLATYEVRVGHLDESDVKYNLLFPGADGDLKEFWESDRYVLDKNIIPWIAEQCWKLSDALNIIHYNPDNFESRYGIHGDIKPANILVFPIDSVHESESLGRLVIGDFGLAHFHRENIRIRSSDIDFSPTYSAPEHIDGEISREVDIWALGCVFLEFITWFLMGSEAVSCTFPKLRLEADATLAIQSDKFFQADFHGDREPPIATIKPVVLDWMAALRKSDDCSGYFKSLLDLIERGVPSVVSVRRVSNEGDQERVHMQIGTTAPEATGSFAFASTHFESRRFTSAVVFGCSRNQIRDVKRLVSSFRHTNRHPLLMLGIFAELELRRIEKVMSARLRDYMHLKTNLQDAAERFGVASRQRYYRPRDEKHFSLFSWDTVKQFLTIRDQLQDAEEEIEAAKRHLDKVCRQFDELREDYKRENNQNEEASKENLEVTQILSERFYDIASRLDGFSSQCRLRVESISFWTEFTGSEFARQEANISAQNAKLATFIAFMALVYLPITGVATILAMPIFGWANDWKDLLFQSVETIDKFNGSSVDSGSASVTGTSLPVVSGYIWVYISMSFLLLIVTLAPFVFIIYHRGGDRQPKGADTRSAATGPDDERAMSLISLPNLGSDPIV
ncbi:hypothetical protein NUW58_g2437 [Xylaria curta]|uniref:Uncharacterized protein n=1 Tax=Xylaria curta TaxID=42375 RepID=A0ACC1PFL1_9PEZI|nr:hypothetical protein NUW58_g2437 [Xylaria curta]